MKLSAPIHRLRSHAKDIKKNNNVPLADALDQVARKEGYATWSLLISKRESLLPNNFSELLDFLNPGDLVLVGARPGVGKTLFSAGLLAHAIEADRPGYLFELTEREEEMRPRLDAHLTDPGNTSRCYIDCSDDIDADYIIATVSARGGASSGLERGTVVVDYLQMLDEKRSSPSLQTQIETLKVFAKETGCIVVFISQVRRQVADRADQRPGLEDIRLPNPLDLDLFNKIIFLYRETPAGENAEVLLVGKFDHNFQITLDRAPLRFVDRA